MKKVLFVATDGLSKTGVPNVFMNIMRNMKPLGYIFDVLYFDKTMSYYEDEIIKLGGKVIYSDLDEHKTNKLNKLLWKKRTSKIIERIIKEYGPYDSIHSFKDLDSGYILRAAQKLGVPSRISHMAFTYKASKNPFVNMVEKHEKKLIDKYANYIISDSTKTSKNNIPFSKKNIVVRNFYDEKFSFSELDNNAKDISLIQIGTYSFNKNQKFSLLILKELVKQYPNSVLHYVGFKTNGNPKYYDELVEEIKTNGLEKHIVFHAHDEDTNLLFKQCHYLIFPSLMESFGIVPVEAQAAGLSCFCSNTVTRENNCGGCIYLPLEEPQKWVDAIIKDFEISKGLHKHFDLGGFSKESIVKQYVKIYGNELDPQKGDQQ